MDRPIISLQHETSDKLLDVVGWIGVVISIIVPLYYWNELPHSIPRHFDATGRPDGFGGKWIIWIVPTINLLLYAGMHWVNGKPHLFNFPQRVTKENVLVLYTLGAKMLRILKVMASCSLAYLTYSTVQSALGYQNGLGSWFLPTFLLCIMGSAGYYLFILIKV